MSFLPEEDQEFLVDNGISHELLTEKLPDGKERRAVRFPALTFVGNLYVLRDGGLHQCQSCDVLVVVPEGYATTKLDSFYTIPHLKRADGTDPQNTGAGNVLFEKSWQFWSRHLNDQDWRVGIDGLRTYLMYIRGELRRA